jgi:general stress protein CsbA
MNQYSALEWLFFLCFLVIIAVIGTNYFLGIQLTTVLKNLFTKLSIDRIKSMIYILKNT